MPKLISIDGRTTAQDISKEDLGSIIARYKAERLLKLPPELAEDCTSVWISKEKILDFFARNPNATGARFYYGVVDDPYVSSGIHNLVLISTINERQDQISDTDSVLVTENLTNQQFIELNAPPLAMHVLLCPPPIDRCNGRAY